MKHFPFIIASALIFSSCGNSSDKSAVDSAKKDSVMVAYFGDTITTEGAIPTDQIKTKLGSQDKAEMKVEGKIVSVCQKKGCWMELELPNNESIHVSFKDYGFFVPKDASGKSVVMQGVAMHDTTSVEMLKELASDAGKSKEEIEKITTPEIGVVFEASGVIIKD
ncbi:hypothetical protein BH09BAC5_BH09BAC5_19780 [soil metagenome]